MHASWFYTIPQLQITPRDSASSFQMSAFACKKADGTVWMVHLKSVPANGKTSPDGPKHLRSETALYINQFLPGAECLSSQRAKLTGVQAR